MFCFKVYGVALIRLVRVYLINEYCLYAKTLKVAHNADTLHFCDRGAIWAEPQPTGKYVLLFVYVYPDSQCLI